MKKARMEMNLLIISSVFKDRTPEQKRITAKKQEIYNKMIGSVIDGTGKDFGKLQRQ